MLTPELHNKDNSDTEEQIDPNVEEKMEEEHLENGREMDDNMDRAPLVSTRVRSRISKRNALIGIYSKITEKVFDDSYLYCYECNDTFSDGCAQHPVDWLFNIPMECPFISKRINARFNDYFDNSMNIVFCKCKNMVKTHILGTLPGILEIRESNIENAGFGIWTRSAIRMGTTFGPYLGVIRFTNKTGVDKIFEKSLNGCSWLVSKNIYGSEAHIVDASDGMNANWLRYVNCARNEEEQNLVAVQYKGCIFYRAYRDIDRGKELLTYYSQKPDNGIHANIDEEMKHMIFHWISENSGMSNSIIKSKLDAKFPHKPKVSIREIFKLINNTLDKPELKTDITEEIGLFIIKIILKNHQVTVPDICRRLNDNFKMIHKISENVISQFIMRNHLRPKNGFFGKLDKEMKVAVLNWKIDNPTMTLATISKNLLKQFPQKQNVTIATIWLFLNRNGWGKRKETIH